jgi:peroxiredoxin
VLALLAHFNEAPLSLDDVRAGAVRDLEKSEVGYMAPGFTLRDLRGKRESLADYRGRVVILNMWATWCAPCRVEMPSMETLYRRYRSQGLAVLAVSLDKAAPEGVKNFVEEHQLSFPVLLDPDGEAERLYSSYTIPMTYVIDKSGAIVAKVDGAKNWGSPETFEAVEFLLKRS